MSRKNFNDLPEGIRQPGDKLLLLQRLKQVKQEKMRLKICNNKQTDQVFVHLKPQDKNKALVITPNGIVLALNRDLFTEIFEIEEEEALSNGVINRSQYNTYSQYR
jgi:hypothetical protein